MPENLDLFGNPLPKERPLEPRGSPKIAKQGDRPTPRPKASQASLMRPYRVVRESPTKVWILHDSFDRSQQ